LLNDFITENSIEGVDNKLDIQQALEKLTERERLILSLHLYGYSYKEISKKTNYSQSQVSRILVNIANESSLHILTR
jgi:RNA polymerase sigma factor (sigma-70 family)